MIVKFLKVKQYKEVLEVFRNRYPKCFNETIRTLKKGMLIDVEIEGMSKRVARSFLHMYTSTKEYMEVHIPGAIRIDLEGNPAGIVTEEECEGKKNNKVVSIIQRIFERAANPPKKKFKKPQKKDANQDQKKDTTPEIKKPLSPKTLSIGWKKKEENH
jgi:ProP effector